MIKPRKLRRRESTKAPGGSGFQDLLARYAGTALAHQLALNDLLGERDWSVDLEAGTATFGGDLTYDLQVIGSQSESGGTWLWGWANEASALPHRILTVAHRMRVQGSEMGVPELVQPLIPVDDLVNGHTLSMVAAGITGTCYYRGPYPGGALFFLLSDPPSHIVEPVTAERAVKVILHMIENTTVRHRPAIGHFLAGQHWRVAEINDEMTADHHSGSTLRITFDQMGRMTELISDNAPTG